MPYGLKRFANYTTKVGLHENLDSDLWYVWLHKIERVGNRWMVTYTTNRGFGEAVSCAASEFRNRYRRDTKA